MQAINWLSHCCELCNKNINISVWIKKYLEETANELIYPEGLKKTMKNLSQNIWYPRQVSNRALQSTSFDPYLLANLLDNCLNQIKAYGNMIC